MTVTARSRAEAHVQVDVACRVAEERLEGALAIVGYKAVASPPGVRLAEIEGAGFAWTVARDPAFREAIHAAVDRSFDAAEEMAGRSG